MLPRPVSSTSGRFNFCLVPCDVLPIPPYTKYSGRPSLPDIWDIWREGQGGTVEVERVTTR